MYEPIVRSSKLKRYAINGFKGLNETESIADNEFAFCENVVGAYPAVSVRPHMKIYDMVGADAEKIISLERDGESYLFTGIASDESGRKFFYKSKEQPLADSYTYTLTAESVCRMNGKIFIFPDKVYFDENAPEKGLCDMTRSVSVVSARFSSEVADDVITNYISGADFSVFRRGESIIINGCSAEGNNVYRSDKAGSDDIISAIIEKIEDDRLYLLCYTASGEDAVFTNVTSSCTISADIPDMNRVCCQNNRLWGTSADGTTIYASKPGDPFDFNSFAGISTDSWWGQVASDGDFVGIYPYQNHVYAFKGNCIHEIYGDKPSNFKMPYSVKCGSIDGDSICEIGGVMYFTAADGVYSYNGGVPSKISQKLNISPKVSKAAAYNSKLFVTIDDILYIYDTEYGNWYRIGKYGASQCYNDENGLFMVSDGIISRWNDGKEAVKWSIQSKEFFRNESEKKGCINLWLRMALSSGTCVAVYTSSDGGEFRRWGVLRGDSCMRRIPVRFRKCDTFSIRLEGVGDCKLYGIEFENYNGGY